MSDEQSEMTLKCLIRTIKDDPIGFLLSVAGGLINTLMAMIITPLYNRASIIECVVYMLCLVICCVLNTLIFLVWHKKSNKIFSAINLFIAVTFALCMNIGIHLTYDFEKSIPVIGLLTIAYIVYFYIIIDLIFGYFDRKNFDVVIIKNQSKTFYCICGLMLILWLPTIIMSFPGNITYDTGTSIIYHLGIDRGNVNNPFLQNIIFGNVYKIGEALGNIDISVFLYCIFQVFCFAACISKGLVILLNNGCPIKIILLIVMLYGCLPFVPMYVFCMGKDSSFGLIILWFSLQLFELLKDDKKFFSKSLKIILLGFSATLLGLLRNAMYIISIISFILCILLGKCQKQNKNILISLIVIVIAINIGLPKFMHIPDGTIGEMLSIPLQQTGYYVNSYEDEITEKEKNGIESVIQFTALYKYNPDISDPIKAEFNNEATKEELKEYFRIWFLQFKKHPLSYFKATILGTYGYYSPIVDKSNIKPHCFYGYSIDSMVFEKTLIEANDNKYLDLLRVADERAMNLPVIGVWSKIGIYTWLLAVAFVYILTRKKYKYIPCLVPAIMVFLQCIISPVNGYFRYAFPMIITVPIICVLVMCVSLERRVNNK